MSVTLINIFEVPAGDEDEFIAAWEKTRDYLKTFPAHIETALHQSLHDTQFRFAGTSPTGRQRMNSMPRSAARDSGRQHLTCTGRSIPRCIRWCDRLRVTRQRHGTSGSP